MTTGHGKLYGKVGKSRVGVKYLNERPYVAFNAGHRRVDPLVRHKDRAFNRARRANFREILPKGGRVVDRDELVKCRDKAFWLYSRHGDGARLTGQFDLVTHLVPARLHPAAKEGEPAAWWLSFSPRPSKDDRGQSKVP